MSLVSAAVPVVSGDLSQLSMLSAGGKEALWIDRGWRNGEKDPESKLLNGIGRETTCADYAEVDTRNLSTFYNPRKEMMSNPTPYATTTLLNRDDCNVSVYIFSSGDFRMFLHVKRRFGLFLKRSIKLS